MRTDEQLVRLDGIYAHGVFRAWRHIARQFQNLRRSTSTPDRWAPKLRDDCNSSPAKLPQSDGRDRKAASAPFDPAPRGRGINTHLSPA